MPGKILIADAVATNRIVLKVKLSAAHFDVLQAPTGKAALALARSARPDLVIVNAALPDMDCADLIGTLRAHAELAVIPVVVLLPGDDAPARIAALKAGADDVIAQPLDERIMLARLRGLMRQHHALQDMRLNAGPDCATGFSEAQGAMIRPGRIALIGTRMSDAMALRARLRSVCHHQITALLAGGPITQTPGTPAADVFALMVMDGRGNEAMERMAELSASLEARHGHIVAILPPGHDSLAASLLDMGASDVIMGDPTLDELTLRLGRQVQRKQATDLLRARLHDGLRAAMIDPLTGLYNRRFAMPFIEEQVAAQTGDAKSFAVMIADLDHFKQINDRHGHAAGDRVLCRVADLLGSGVREGDMVARIGGEEFLIVLPCTGETEAQRIANQLCRRIATAEIALHGQTRAAHVTVSIGAALGRGGAPAGETKAAVDTLLDQADRALYRAKARGRNTAALSGPRAAA